MGVLREYRDSVWRTVIVMAALAMVSAGCQPHFRTEYRVAAGSEASLRQPTYDEVVAAVGPVCSARGLERTDLTGIVSVKAADWAKTLSGTHIVLGVWVEDRGDFVVISIEEYRSPRQTNEGRELREAVLRAVDSIPNVRVVDKNG
jgi:hypothetical protein